MTNNDRAGDSSPRKYMATPARPAGLVGKVQLRAGTPEAVLAVVPHMLGFYPSRSLVVLGLGERNRVVVTFRYDLPDPFDYDLATDIAQHADFVLGREGIKAALLVGYGPAELVNGVAAITSARLCNRGVDVPEVLRADSGRFWSLLCGDVTCCPPQGRSYDPGSHPAAATMTEAGLTAHPDRDALARTIQRPAGSADRVSRATVHAQLRLAQLVDLGGAEGDRDLSCGRRGLGARRFSGPSASTGQVAASPASSTWPGWRYCSPTSGSATTPGPGWTPRTDRLTASYGPTFSVAQR
jgi:hypothetical protein